MRYRTRPLFAALLERSQDYYEVLTNAPLRWGATRHAYHGRVPSMPPRDAG
jgi:hypothetical protein